MTTVQIELEKITQIGEKLGLKGQELKQFIEDERTRLKKERQERESERELRRKELEIQELKAKTPQQADSNRSVRNPKLPQFNEKVDDIDAYINRFERYVTSQGWDKKRDWAINLGALLQGRALYEYSTLPFSEASDYDKVKRAVLKAYKLNAEGFRKKFRYSRPII
ncbi:hypothetical protein HOLleu_44755 [Holothuria leucospilota]|uniref:Uncharacterized protein n=1 Tax=Holothuria leucospilota TaxID=206669 RepID=A0A9Q1BAQ4_HOLLE|nr:hypothetical protein HOLleu_44755 [Holothuria leucospilota]